jgi:hypothetical protein
MRKASEPDRIVAFCVDVGSTKKGNFGWARARRRDGEAEVVGGNNIDDCVKQIRSVVGPNTDVALGLEAPLWLPVPSAAEGLSAGRDGEADRSCFAMIGGYVATLAVHQLAYILRGIGRDESVARCTLDWRTWPGARGEVLIWEAMVSKGPHARSERDGHSLDVLDAATAACPATL